MSVSLFFKSKAEAKFGPATLIRRRREKGKWGEGEAVRGLRKTEQNLKGINCGTGSLITHV